MATEYFRARRYTIARGLVVFHRHLNRPADSARQTWLDTVRPAGPATESIADRVPP